MIVKLYFEVISMKVILVATVKIGGQGNDDNYVNLGQCFDYFIQFIKISSNNGMLNSFQLPYTLN